MSCQQQILFDRENRHNLISSLTENHNVISVKANVAGGCKNIYPSFVLCNYFANVIYKKWGYKPIIDQNSDGVCYIFALNDDFDYKAFAIDLEENTPIGRFVDIDVHLKNTSASISRNKTRKCYLCDNPAFVCGRLKSHPISQLNDFLTKKTNEFFTQKISEIIKFSLVTELELENKFGLVTKNSKGSHADMDYNLMLTAQDSIIDTLTQGFFVGLTENTPERFIDFLRPIGLECENKMFTKTGGVNAYKGFIFISLILLSAIGYTIKTCRQFDDIFEIAKQIATHTSVDKPLETFGYNAYTNNFLGLRGETKKGFPSVKNACEMLNDNSLHKVLTTIVSQIDDSVLLKRAKTIDNYNHFKNLISSVDTRDENALISLTDYCIQNNVSIGGSADVLCASIMLNKLKEIFYL